MIFHVGWDHSHGEPGCVVTAGVPLGAEHQGPSRAFRNPLFITCNTPQSLPGPFFALLQHSGMRIASKALLAAAGSIPSAGNSQRVPQQPPVGKSTNKHRARERRLLQPAKDLPLCGAARGNGAQGVRQLGTASPAAWEGAGKTERTRRQHTRKGRFLLGFSSYESSCTDQHTEAA